MSRALLRALCCLALAAVPAAAQRDGCTRFRPRVERLAFEGNTSITNFDLAQILYTERAGRLRRWFGWNVGPTACLDTLELGRDERRIAAWYNMRGYPGTTARAEVARTSSRTANVTFRVREAPPVVIDTVRLANVPRGLVDQARLVRALRGAPLDDSVLVATMDSVQQILRAEGYARARPPTRSVTVDTAARRARVTLTFTPGPLMRVGAIEVAMTPNDSGRPALREDEVRALLRFESGDVYSARSVGASQQLLYSYDLYRTVAIDTLPSRSTGDTLPVRVRLVEGRHNALRVGGGWGTIDCFRTQSRFVEQNFLGRGHRLQLDLRLSKLGVGTPFDGAPGLCAPAVRADTFSLRLNYYVGATVNLRGVLGDRWHPVGTLYSERRTEFQSYVRETSIGGIGSFDRPLVPRVNTTFAYRFDAGRTTSDAAVSCATFGLCRFNDRFLLNSPSVMHAAGVTFSRSAPAITAFASNDERWAIESRLGTVNVGRPGTRVNFNRTQLEYALYRPLTRTLVGAARLSAGFVATRRDLEAFVPPQERFYSGGQNSVRGYNQGQLGPTVYIVRAPSDTVTVGGALVGNADPSAGFDRTAPAGGTATALLNLELRSRVGWPSDLLRWVLFLDAGRVWNNSGNYAVTGLRATPGLGVRLVTPLGPFRVDVGYNPHPREAGPAFYLQRASATTLGRAICVSPGSTEPLDDAAAGALGPVPCPASFRPLPPRGLLPRLTFHFSIGEAF
ncbi:BamA/TamA family outer membrane protein [Pseudogemmatithrix spongiicola]|uniref:BamA/TamA family outer membrane protein n=1 Tax=Pseudogemmatithrix spongiicola TaxID=3062599 RepID=A0AA49JZ87_9BACT|nr:BamA/TamA family outer membrane protein [Gemmatimonadaceae bacterium 'strain 138']WKW14507.1 BamA/TamA family outer membrane protein [Gemmatimonadaceae bacterium 'strain 318']